MLATTFQYLYYDQKIRKKDFEIFYEAIEWTKLQQVNDDESK